MLSRSLCTGTTTERAGIAEFLVEARHYRLAAWSLSPNRRFCGAERRPLTPALSPDEEPSGERELNPCRAAAVPASGRHVQRRAPIGLDPVELGRAVREQHQRAVRQRHRAHLPAIL